MIEAFREILAELNQKGIKVYLLGSFGAELVLGSSLYPDDIDIQILEKDFERFSEISELMKGLGYQLIDEDEHKFYNGQTKVGFASVETLREYASVDFANIPKNGDFYLPSLEQMIAIYQASVQDKWRQKQGKTAKDELILRKLKEKL